MSLSAYSVGHWEQYLGRITGTSLWPDKPPLITCMEDLTIAAKAVRESFRRAAESLQNDKKEDCFNKFDKRKYGDPVWYRGDPDWHEGRSLCPSVFRPDYYLKNEKGFRSAEKWTLTEFWRKAVLRDVHCPDPGHRQAWLALAQHHGLPTRLLDWSESILAAAWFAVHGTRKAILARDLADTQRALVTLRESIEAWLGGNTDALYSLLDEKAREAVVKCRYPNGEQTVIWALSPALMNFSLNTNGPFFFLEPDDPMLTDAFRGDGDPEKVQVFAIWVQDVHPRMMSQSAYFTIHSNDKSLKDINDNCPPAKQFLRKLVIRADAKEMVYEALVSAGVSQSTIFPDLDNLARIFHQFFPVPYGATAFLLV